MSDRLRHVLRALSAPWAITPEGFETVCSIIDRRAAGVRLTDDEIRAIVDESRAEFEARHEASQGLQQRGGNKVALISIYGTILPRPVLNISGGGGTSMQEFMRAFKAADEDPSVGAILLDVDSPGGSAYLVPEAGAMIANASKPVTAIANAVAASAAYWLASQADEFVVTPSGQVGSIGVFARHVDFSEQLAQEGVKVTLVSFGANKTEGNPYEPLSDDARATIQASVDEYGEMFVDAVARGRGVSPEDVRAKFGDGRMFSAVAAAGLGMVDRVATFDAVVEQMLGTSTSGGNFRADAIDLDVAAAHKAALAAEHDAAKSAEAWSDDVEYPLVKSAHDKDSPEQPAEQHDGAAKTVTYAPHAERLLARPEFREAYSNGR
jgi:signal peptide peptidase SppA